MSLERGTFPTNWKIAAVTPLYKGKGSKSDTLDYRPISCIPVISKLLESIVRDAILSYTAVNNLITMLSMVLGLCVQLSLICLLLITLLLLTLIIMYLLMWYYLT